jgi:hypothetical protein
MTVHHTHVLYYNNNVTRFTLQQLIKFSREGIKRLVIHEEI